MILGTDTRPDQQLYHLGARILSILNGRDRHAMRAMDLYVAANQEYAVSANAFALTLDWLFLAGAIRNNDGSIERCS